MVWCLSSYLTCRHELQWTQGALHVGDVGLELVQRRSDAGLDLGRFLPRRAVGSDLVERLLRHPGGGVWLSRRERVLVVVSCWSKSSKLLPNEISSGAPRIAVSTLVRFGLAQRTLNREQSPLSPSSHLRLGRTSPFPLSLHLTPAFLLESPALLLSSYAPSSNPTATFRHACRGAEGQHSGSLICLPCAWSLRSMQTSHSRLSV